MKLAVISDIHSNYDALARCYECIDGISPDGIIYAGDYISDCAMPHETLNAIREKSEWYKSWFIKGNREEYILSHINNPNDGWRYNSNSESLLFTYENLTNEDFDFINGLPDNLTVELPGTAPITVVHGSPMSNSDHLWPGEEKTNQVLMSCNTDYMICAHTHKQFIYEYNGKTLVNPGVVGTPNGGGKGADFVILEWNGGKWMPELITVLYDVEKAVKHIYEKGMFEKAKIWSQSMIETLRTGENYAMRLIVLAHGLAVEGGINRDEFNIPEKYWEEAGKQMGWI